MMRRQFLPAVPLLMVIAMLGPVAAGLYGTLLPAFGHLSAAGEYGPNLDAFRALFDWPGLRAAIRLSVTTGVLATFLSLLIVMLVTAGWSGTRRPFVCSNGFSSPLLSVPHAAAAFGLAFLITPSGWIARLFFSLADWVGSTARFVDCPRPVGACDDAWHDH